MKTTAAVFLCASLSLAKDRPKIQLRVVETQQSERDLHRYVPGTDAKSTTNCTGNATAVGAGNTASASGSSNCTTTTTPGNAPREYTVAVPQANVLAVMPDGKHITIWCQNGWRRCEPLDKGTYEAEIDGETIWVAVPYFNGKIIRVKYKYAGGW